MSTVRRLFHPREVVKGVLLLAVIGALMSNLSLLLSAAHECNEPGVIRCERTTNSDDGIEPIS